MRRGKSPLCEVCKQSFINSCKYEMTKDYLKNAPYVLWQELAEILIKQGRISENFYKELNYGQPYKAIAMSEGVFILDDTEKAEGKNG